MRVFCKISRHRELIITDSNFGDAQPLDAVSKRISSRFLKKIKILFGYYWFWFECEARNHNFG
jgi:hypothetical protein